jgi:hypothetical protein
VTLGGQSPIIAAVSVSVFLIGDHLYNLAVGAILGLAMGAYWTLWFFVLPMRIRRRHTTRRDTTSST